MQTMDGSKEDKIIFPKFNDKSTASFHPWKLRMEAVLEAKNFLDIVVKT